MTLEHSRQQTPTNGESMLSAGDSLARILVIAVQAMG